MSATQKMESIVADLTAKLDAALDKEDQALDAGQLKGFSKLRAEREMYAAMLKQAGISLEIAILQDKLTIAAEVAAKAQIDFHNS